MSGRSTKALVTALDELIEAATATAQATADANAALITSLQSQIDAQDVRIVALEGSSLPTISYNNDPVTGGSAVWTVENLGDGVTVSGTWTDSDASVSAPVDVYVEIDGQDVTDDGGWIVSNEAATTGSFTWASPRLSPAVDSVNISAKIEDSDGNTTAVSRPFSYEHTDPLRELAGHPNSDTTDWSWTSPPTWTNDTAGTAGMLSTTGYRGAALLDTTVRTLSISYDPAAPTVYVRFGVGLPGSTRFQWNMKVNTVSVASGTVTGEVLFSGQPDEITVDLGYVTLTGGQTLDVEIYCDRTVAFGGASEYGVLQFISAEKVASPYTDNANDIWIDPVSGNNVTGTVGKKALPYQSLEYIGNNNSLVVNGTASQPTTIWVKRGTSHTSAGGKDAWIVNKEYVHIRPYDSGAMPIYQGGPSAAGAVQPTSSIYWPAGSPGTDTFTRGLMEFKDCIGCGVESMHVRYSAGSGIAIRNSTENTKQSADNFIRFCRVDETASDGIFVGAEDINVVGSPSNVLRPDVFGNEVTSSNNQEPSLTTGCTGQAITFISCTGGGICCNNVYDNYKEAIDVIESQDVVIRDNQVGADNASATYASGTLGIYSDAFSSGSNNIIIENNTVTGQTNGIVVGAELLGTSSKIYVRNNLVHDCGSAAIAITGGSSSTHENIYFENNTVEVPAGSVEFCYTNTSPGTVRDVYIRGNSFSRPSTGTALANISLGSHAAETTVDNNHFYNGSEGVTGETGTNATLGDPLWVTQALDHWPFSTDYYPGASSPVLGKVTSSKLVTRDLRKTRRSLPHDLGAFER